MPAASRKGNYGAQVVLRRLPRTATPWVDGTKNVGPVDDSIARSAVDRGAIALSPAAYQAVFEHQTLQSQTTEHSKHDDAPQQRHVAITLPSRATTQASVYTPRWHTLIVPIVPAAPTPTTSALNDYPEQLPTPELPLAYVSRRLQRSIGSSLVYVRPVDPIALTSVVLATPSTQLLALSESELAAHLHARLLRQEQVLYLTITTGVNANVPVRVVMAEPVLQGIITPDTQLTLVLCADDSWTVEDDEIDQDDGRSTVTDDQQAVGTSVSSLPVGQAEDELDDDGESTEEEDLLIDERFLAQTLTKLEPPPSFAVHESGGSNHKRRTTHVPTLFTLALPDAHAVETVLSTWCSSTNDRSRADVDEQAVVLLPESQLALVGAFHGQYALLSLAVPAHNIPLESQASASTTQRLVQVFGAPSSLLPSTISFPNDRNTTGRKTELVAFLPPLLHHNLLTAYSESESGPCQTQASTNRVNLAPLAPSLAPNGQPPIPFAERLTLARVASPASVDKAYEPLSLAALRLYFAGHRRVVLNGDLIAVALDGRATRWIGTGTAPSSSQANGSSNAQQQLHQSGAGVTPNVSTGNGYHPNGPPSVSARGSDAGVPTTNGEEDELDIATLSLPGGNTAPTEVVFFRVAHVRADLDPTPPIPFSGKASSTSQNGSHAGDSVDQLALRSRTWNGALGSLVDPGLTQIVQAGLVHSRVPTVSHWLGLDTGLPFYPTPNSALTLPHTPLGQLQALLRAALHPVGARAGVHVTALLSGARGSGKRTTALWAAQSVGVHVVSIDCYALLADSATKTEGILRARLERAKQAAPAVVLLRGIEALASKAQATQDGHEPAMTRVLADCLEGLKVTPPKTMTKDGRPDIHTQRPTASNTITTGTTATTGTTTQEGASDSEEFHPLVVLGTTSESEKCPTGLLALFKHTVQWDAPNESERLSILQGAIMATSTPPPPVPEPVPTVAVGLSESRKAAAPVQDVTGNIVLAPDVTLKSLATQTAALVAADLADLVARAKAAATARIRAQVPAGMLLADVLSAGVSLTGSDFDAALASARATYSESIGAPKIPNVTWDDVGGLAAVKHDILDTIQLPLERPDLFADGLKKRSGVLLYGPPGTGKTLLAKAVATSCSLNFFSVKGPELLNMYIGESEANVRRVFQKARDATPCVIFFDELDSVAPKRGNQGDSGGVMDRIVSQLLAELDGMASGGGDVFVIGATNRPDLLDPALLRPGRFDKLLYLSVAETHAAQQTILQALTRKFRLDPDVGDLGVVADQCPFNLTGADFYALASDAMLKAMTRKANEVDTKIAQLNAQPGPHDWPTPLTAQYYLSELANREDYEVSVSRADFELALHELVPSVSEDEMAHYRAVRAKFEDPEKDKPADGSSQSLQGDGDTVHIDLSAMGTDDPNELSLLAQAAQKGDSKALQMLQNILEPNGHFDSVPGGPTAVGSGSGPGSGSVSGPGSGPSSGSTEFNQLAGPIEASHSNGTHTNGSTGLSPPPSSAQHHDGEPPKPTKNKGKGKARAD